VQRVAGASVQALYGAQEQLRPRLFDPFEVRDYDGVEPSGEAESLEKRRKARIPVGHDGELGTCLAERGQRGNDVVEHEP
jgi:hypothetical protein